MEFNLEKLNLAAKSKECYNISFIYSTGLWTSCLNILKYLPKEETAQANVLSEKQDLYA